MKLSFSVALLGLLLTTTYARVVDLTRSQESPTIEKRGPVTTSYIDATAAQHQTYFNTLASTGYRMISLSTYGSPPLYAAAWIQRSGPGWYAIHNTDGAGYQAWFNSHSASFVSTIITVTGPRNSATYAGVMEQISVSGWYQKCDMTPSQYSTEIGNAKSNRYILKSFSEYGTPADRRFCAIWHYNDNYDKHTVQLSQTYSNYQATFNSETTKPFWRPSYLSVSEDYLISSTFTDTDVGSWVARHGLTATTFNTENTNQQAAGRYLIHLQGGGAAGNYQYAALWADHDTVTPRSWQTTGSLTGFTNNAAALTASDNLMESFMKQNGVRQAQFTVSKNGKLIMERGYSWSEATRHTTTPADTFLLASLSKMFIEATIQNLYDAGKLTPSTTAYPLLGYSNPSDARLSTITIQQLLDHEGGYNISVTGFDPTYQMRAIALAQSGGSRAATVKDVVDYMFKQPLQFAPGTGSAYSNYGYLLLSDVVEKVTGMPYYSYLSQAILTPGGYNVKAWLSSPATHVNEPITQESADTGLSALEPLSPAPVAAIYTGDGMHKDSALGPAALAASASTIANFIHTHAVWGNGPRRAGNWARSGSTPGTSTFAESLSDGTDWAITVNTRDWAPYSGATDPFSSLCGTGVPNFLAANTIP
jgi:CubicO group peptidase (beta-lactamase class C family)